MLCLLAVGVVAIGQQRVPARKIRAGEFSNAESVETKFLALSRRICHQADSSTVVRRFFRGTASLYIFSILFSRKSRVPLDAAFSYLFLFISGLLFCAAGIISAARIHPQLAFLCRRDDFCCADASLSCSFPPQGLLRPPGFISILLFCAAGITSSAQMHLYLVLFHHRDYCDRPDSSLSCSFLPQGLLLPPGFILILLFRAAGIISSAQMHLYLALFHHRDYCDHPDSSLSCSFVPQGLFLPLRFIPGLLFSSAGIISTARIHLYLTPPCRRDYCDRPASSLSCSFSPQGLLRPLGFILILLFCAAGITSSAQIHLYLAFLCCRDYFRRSDSSLSCFFLRRDYF